jgi:hypothetical protein
MHVENLQKLTNLIKQVIGDSSFNVATIKNPQYVSLYLPIFFDEIKRNGGKAIPYDQFGEELWNAIGEDVNQHPTVSDEFIIIWSAWKTLYDALQNKGYIKD